MISGIGVDAVEIKRFARWHTFSQKQLLKIFTPQELKYSFENSLKTAERLAVRFAAKEAFYKAGSGMLEHKSLYYNARHVGVEREIDQKPVLVVDWQRLFTDKKALLCAQTIKVHVSLTHTEEIAIAYVILENV